MNLLFAINRKFTSLLCQCIHSVIQNGGADGYEAYILHSDLEQEYITRICREAGDRMNCHFLPVDEAVFEGFPETGRYPKQIYYRLAAPLLLPAGLERILYLDVDLVVINSLQELYDTDFEGNYYVASSHVRQFLTKVNQLRLGVEDHVPYINTGVMLLNLPLLRRNLTMEQIRDTAQKKMHTFMLPDQDLLTVMHGEHIKLVDTMRYNLSDRMLITHNANPRNEPIDLQWVRENAVIIHYFGKNKPWSSAYNGILDVFFRENLDTMEAPPTFSQEPS